MDEHRPGPARATLKADIRAQAGEPGSIISVCPRLLGHPRAPAKPSGTANSTRHATKHREVSDAVCERSLDDGLKTAFPIAAPDPVTPHLHTDRSTA